MEDLFLYAGYILYILYFISQIIALLLYRQKNIEKSSIIILVTGICLHGAALAARWIRLGHAPYLGIYEGLLSGLWVSSVFYAHLIIIKPNFRKTGTAGGFFLVLWYTWLMIIDRSDTVLPAIYDTWWLSVHVLSGKISYGALFPVFILALHHIIVSSIKFSCSHLSILPTDMEKFAYRYMTMVFTFATAMMISGGIWAQKAWGREWSWESLEVWSLAVWLSYGLYIHMRITYNKTLKKIWGFYVIISYLLTFYNLFGIPFLSEVIHKGVL